MELGVDRRRQRMVASIIERKHTVIDHMLVADNGHIVDEVYDVLGEELDQATTPVLIFAVHLAVAEAATKTLTNMGYTAATVHGKMTKLRKNDVIEEFKAGKLQALVGTQTLATGTDGLDKVCDLLVILDDTDDGAMRRQLIGRIMPRGEATSQPHSNRVVRIVSEPIVQP